MGITQIKMKRTLIIFGIAVLLLILILVSSNTEFENPLPSGRLTSKFGEQRSGYIHNGIDLAAPVGTVIVAPASGIVTGKNTSKNGGNQLFILHPNGYRTGYAHLSAYLVNTGDRVKKGQAIARVGNTGRSSGPHLHFTVTNSIGVKIDPLTLFQA